MDPILSVVAGATILTVIGIMSGGTFLLRVATGGVPVNETTSSAASSARGTRTRASS